MVYNVITIYVEFSNKKPKDRLSRRLNKKVFKHLYAGSKRDPRTADDRIILRYF
jgi:hypothetical protein